MSTTKFAFILIKTFSKIIFRNILTKVLSHFRQDHKIWIHVSSTIPKTNVQCYYFKLEYIAVSVMGKNNLSFLYFIYSFIGSFH